MDSFGPGILQIELFKQKKQADSAAHKRCRLSDNIGYEHKNHAITCSKLAVSIEVCTKLHLQSGSQIPSGNQTCQGKSRRVFQSIFPNSNHYFEGMFPYFRIQTIIFGGFSQIFAFKPLFLKDFQWHFVHSHLGDPSPLFRELFRRWEVTAKCVAQRFKMEEEDAQVQFAIETHHV